MLITSDSERVLGPGSYTFLFRSPGGTAQLSATVKDPNVANSSYLTDAAFTKSASAVINYTVHGEVKFKPTLAGTGGELYLLENPARPNY